MIRYSFIAVLLCLQFTMDAQKLNVAIYPYLPRGDQFKQVLSQAWSAQYPGVQLDFVNWDCYSSPSPPDSLHVFVFDGIYYNYYYSQGYMMQLQPNQISSWNEFMPFARQGVTINNDIYALPYLGCSNVYFYRKGDQELDKNLGLNEFYSTIGNCSDTSSLWPNPGQGMLINLAGGTTDACLYANSEMNNMVPYSYTPPTPPASSLDQASLSAVQQYTLMAGYKQAGDGNDDQKIDHFQNGTGRTYIGITENSSSFRPSFLDSVTFRAMPFSPNYNDTIGVYVDMAAINSQTPSNLQYYAQAMVNMMTSYEVMLNSMIPTASAPNPQFLIPARSDVLFRLSNDYPYYLNISRLLFNHIPYAFRIGSNSWTWLTTNKNGIRTQILHPPTYQKYLERYLSLPRPLEKGKGGRIGQSLYYDNN